MHDKDLRSLIHDLRNRIAPIRNATHLLRLRGGADPQLNEMASLIDRQVQAMADLLDAASPVSVTAQRPEVTAAPATAQAEGKGDTTGTGDSTRRIVIGDDSPAVCESLAAILRDLGHEVRCAYDGQETVDVATAWMPDLVLLDINMPKLNGYEVARRLRSQFPSSKMRLVMISGTDLDSGVLAAARQAGFDECLDKLLDFAALKKVLDA
jgi:CheY-like chemotaxis protein